MVWIAFFFICLVLYLLVFYDNLCDDSYHEEEMTKKKYVLFNNLYANSVQYLSQDL